jgi:hypothetical protein
MDNKFERGATCAAPLETHGIVTGICDGPRARRNYSLITDPEPVKYPGIILTFNRKMSTFAGLHNPAGRPLLPLSFQSQHLQKT